MEGGRKRGLCQVQCSLQEPHPPAAVGGHLTEDKNTNSAALITIAAIVCLQLKKQNHHHHHDELLQSGWGINTQVLAVIPTQFRLSEAYLGHSKSRKKEGKKERIKQSRYDTYR